MNIVTHAYTVCMMNLLIVGPSFIIGNTGFRDLVTVYIQKVVIKLIGLVLISRNSASHVIYCKYCDMLFSKDIVFTSNECYNSVLVIHSG